MKKAWFWILLALAATTQAASLDSLSPRVLAPLAQQAEAAALAAKILTRYHYKALPLDESMSEKIFDRYIKALDPEKLFFTQSDIDNLAYARPALATAIEAKELQIPFAIFNLYERRFVERMTHARELLKRDADFNRVESVEYERDKARWPQSEDEMRDLWRKRVKNDRLQLRLAGKDDQFIRDTLEKRYGTSLSRSQRFRAEDVFQVFMNAYARSVEPHTDYLGPKESAEFDISMSLSLVGIGAVLQDRNDYTTIRELLPGGPAALSAKIKVGDRIVAVGQGNDGALADVVGMRLDDVVLLIRGAKNTVVRLDILPADAGPDGQHRLVSLVRNKISLEQQAARKSVIQTRTGAQSQRVGVISLPAFYQDFEARHNGNKEFKSASRDVARLLEQLKQARIGGVLVDLRNNGGGSLDEAVELTCLFTGKGPVVQERNSQGAVRTSGCGRTKRLWDGPMGVLINGGSASASEIFAAAIQDYGRGIVIGERSFGKGTVQTLIDFDQIAHNDKPTLGELKMTVAQFFRVNGGTTQLRGVTPDIGLPSALDPESFGESSFDNALPWIQIEAAVYSPAGDVKGILPLLQTRHTARVAKDKHFQLLLEDVAAIKARRARTAVSLNEAERRQERDLLEARLKSRAIDEAHEGRGRNRKTMNRKDSVPPGTTMAASASLPDEPTLKDELAAEKAQKDARDVWLTEAARILGDEIDIRQASPRLASRLGLDSAR
ncbi:MAG: carboxy terminal-processing peptidase [Sterolibacterium sp.]|jgi:carboxyl-terminal processing protease